MRMHSDRPLPSPGPARILEFIKRLSETNLIKLSRLLAEDQELTKIFWISLYVAKRTHEKRENAANDRESDSTAPTP